MEALNFGREELRGVLHFQPLFHVLVFLNVIIFAEGPETFFQWCLKNLVLWAMTEDVTVKNRVLVDA